MIFLLVQSTTNLVIQKFVDARIATAAKSVCFNTNLVVIFPSLEPELAAIVDSHDFRSSIEFTKDRKIVKSDADFFALDVELQKIKMVRAVFLFASYEVERASVFVSQDTLPALANVLNQPDALQQMADIRRLSKDEMVKELTVKMNSRIAALSKTQCLVDHLLERIADCTTLDQLSTMFAEIKHLFFNKVNLE